MTAVPETVAKAWILKADFAVLEARVAKVNRRAAKLGVAPLTAYKTGETKRQNVGVSEDGIAIFVEKIEVVVDGVAPKLPGGWVHLATIDHREALPIIRGVPGKEMPAEQRERGGICDHCGKVRKRIDTFVLQSEAGDVIQVGRQCLGDFLGVSNEKPEAVLTFWHDASEVLDEFEKEDYEPSGREVEMLDVEDVVMVSGAVIDEFGWMSKSRAEAAFKAPTASLVVDYVWPPKFNPGSAEDLGLQEFIAKVRTRMTPALRKEAKEAVAWASDQQGSTNDYLYNLAAVAIMGTVAAGRNIGLVASLMAAYRREQDRLKEVERKRSEKAGSVFVGEPKQRLELTLTLVAKPRAFENDFGTSYRSEFSDGQNVFVWWASNDPTRKGFEVGVATKAKATVKKHEEFQGIKTTVITRVSAA